MKTCIVASLIASAAAFAPAQQSHGSSTAVSLTMDEMPGSINLFRKEFKFDPLRLSETYQPFLPFFREAELRHGRTAMLAVVGFIGQDFVRLPGDVYSFENIPKTIDAHDKLWELGIASPMAQLLLWIGLWELIVAGPGIIASHKGERAPGDYGMEAYLKRKPMSADKVSFMVDSELLNGRLAMIAVGGIATQSEITGHGFPWL
jgi:light-harvesting complex I chlorophyll a/b binding protein 1